MIDKEWYTAEEVAEHFQVSERTVRRWAERGSLEGCKVGGCLRFRREVVENFPRSSLE